MNLQEFKSCMNAVDESELDKLEEIIQRNNRFIILGNGGSNAISCHIAQDYTKVLGKKALCFGDSSRLSCYANDYGWDNAYAKFIEHMAEKDTVVILISSSGNSQNIINAAKFAIDRGHDIITLSGFDANNKLRSKFADKSLIHFYVASRDYGIVECIHEMILHSVI